MTFLRRFGLLVVGGALVVLGAVFAAIDGSRPHEVSFGWTAYAPLSGTTFRPPGASLYGDGPEILIVIGLVVLVAWLAGRRTSSRTFGRAAAIGIPVIGMVIAVIGLVLAQSADTVLSLSSTEPAGYALVAEGGIGITAIDDQHALLCIAMLIAGVAIIAGSLGYLIARKSSAKVHE